MADIAKESLNLETDTWTGNTDLNKINQNEISDTTKKAREQTEEEAAKSAADADTLIENLNKKASVWRSEKFGSNNVYQKLGEAFKQLTPEEQQYIKDREPMVREKIAQAYQKGQGDFNDMMKLPNKAIQRFKWLFGWSSKQE